MVREGAHHFPGEHGYLFNTHCELSGFLPIHAVTAYGKQSTIDVLQQLDPRLRAQAATGMLGASRFTYLHIYTSAPDPKALKKLRKFGDSTRAELREAKARLKSYAGLSPLQARLRTILPDPQRQRDLSQSGAISVA